MSQFVVLDGSNYQDVHEAYRPILKENKKNPLFVDIQIPYVQDGRAYWLVTATEPLNGKRLNFRSIAWHDSLPVHIQSFVRLGESLDTGKRPAMKRGYIEFTISKKLLSQCYIYHDYEQVVEDGFFYYTYDLAKHTVGPSGAIRSTPVSK